MIQQKENPSSLICISGFLGQRKEWSFLFSLLESAQKLELTFDCMEPQRDFIDARLQYEKDAFQAWTRFFAGHVSKKYRNAEVRPILLGYSLGGRLAMHALIRFPHLFAGAIIVSANPGLGAQAAEERTARVASDEEWAKRFAREPWGPLMEAWNAQGVFRGGGTPPERPEEEFDRKILSAQLRQWSLGKQAELLPELAKLEIPLLYIAGERDERFAALARKVESQLGQKAPAEVWIAPGAGHRVPWDQPELFKSRVQDWIFRVVLGR